MIKKLKGVITEKGEKKITLSIAQSMLEIELSMPNTSSIELKKTYEIHVSMVFSSENGYSLYGFLTDIEKQYFLLLQDCRGVGPRLAITILDSCHLEKLYQGILEKNSYILSTVVGIGEKKAESIMLELHSKIKKVPIPQDLPTSQMSIILDLESALLSLGYAKKEVDSMIKKVFNKKNMSQSSLIDLIREAIV